MQTFRHIRGALVALWLGLCAAAFASAQPLPVTTTPAAGVAGSTVKPAFSLDVNGFLFESLDLTLHFSDPMVSFDLASSTAQVNGQTLAWTALPGYFGIGPVVSGDVGSFQLSAFTIAPMTLTGPLVLRPAFQIRNTAPLGDTPITISGSFGTDPLNVERYFDSSATLTVSAVPEPELWLLWLGGLGLLAWRRTRRSV